MNDVDTNESIVLLNEMDVCVCVCLHFMLQAVAIKWKMLQPNQLNEFQIDSMLQLYTISMHSVLIKIAIVHCVLQ